MWPLGHKIVILLISVLWKILGNLLHVSHLVLSIWLRDARLHIAKLLVELLLRKLIIIHRIRLLVLVDVWLVHLFGEISANSGSICG